MMLAKRIGLILCGLAVGVLTTISIVDLKAQQAARNTVTFTEAGHNYGREVRVFFVTEPKSHGCWIATGGPNGNISTLAPAPAPACQ